MKPSVSHLEAIGFALAGFTFWVLTDTTIKLVGPSGLPAYEVVAFLGLFIAAFLGLHALARRQLRQLWPRNLPRQLVRSGLDLGNNLGVVIALRHLSLTLFYILVFMAPMVTTILSAIFLRERLTWRKSLAILAGFAGVLIAVDPFGAGRHADWTGYAACLLCVICFSINMVWSRVLTQTEMPESLTFFSGLMMAVVGFALMLGRAAPVGLGIGGLLVSMGLFCALGTMCFFIALRHTSAANVAQYHYTQLVTGALMAYLVWHRKPTLFMLMGGVLIAGSGLSIAWAASRERFSAIPLPTVVPE
jgi:drug/metabolite transporter (DMT)-like permease